MANTMEFVRPLALTWLQLQVMLMCATNPSSSDRMNAAQLKQIIKIKL